MPDGFSTIIRRDEVNIEVEVSYNILARASRASHNNPPEPAEVEIVQVLSIDEDGNPVEHVLTNEEHDRIMDEIIDQTEEE